ncbi:MAG: hypothetical protein MRY83_24115 [Flavobacteriales bacterium]|nr:hypothetical protein [Flavobacteriales bacterium]
MNTMKTTQNALLIFLLFSFSMAFAQEPIVIKVTEGTEVLGGKTNNAMTVTIYEATVKEVEKAFKAELKKNKAKVSVKKEIFGDNAAFSSLGDNTVDVYAKVVDKGDKKCDLQVAVDLGGAFMSSKEHKTKYDAFRNYLYGFAVSTTKEAIAGQTKEAEKLQGTMEKDLEKLKSEKEDLEKLIKDCEAKIEQAKKDIETNKENQTKKGKDIEKQKEVVSALQAREKAVK